MTARDVIVAFAVAALIMLAVQGFAAVDDSYTVTLFHFNGDTTDEAGDSWTPHGTDYATSTAKFGSGSFYASGDDYLEANDSDSWSFATAPFTIEAWVNVPSHNSSYRHLITHQNGSTKMLVVDLLNTNKLYFNNYPTGPSLTDSDTFPTGQWVHIAVTRNGDDWRLFRDGLIVASASSSNSMENVDATRRIALDWSGGGSAWWIGYIDELRISKGIARWTAEFTPPMTEYAPPAIINPVYMCDGGFLRLASGGRLNMR